MAGRRAGETLRHRARTLICCKHEHHGVAAGQSVPGVWEKPAAHRRSLQKAERWLPRLSLPSLPPRGAAREAQEGGCSVPPGHRGRRCRKLYDGRHDRRREHSAQLRGPGAPHGVLRGREWVYVAPGQAVLRQPARRCHAHQDAGLRAAPGSQKHRSGRRQEAFGTVDRRRAGSRARRQAAHVGCAISGEDR